MMSFPNSISQASAMFLLSVTSPLQLLKTRLQTSVELTSLGRIPQKYNGVRDCLKKVIAGEGLASLWRGNSIGLARFYINQTINKQARHLLSVDKSSINGNASKNRSFFQNAINAVAGGWIAASIIYPIDSFRMAVTNSIGCNRLLTVFQNIKKEHGIRYLYKGFSSALLTVAMFRGAFNGVFSTLTTPTTTLPQAFSFGYLSALIAGSIIYPLDTLRKRSITINDRKGWIKFSAEVIKKEGIKGLYHGGSVICGQAFVGASILVAFGREQQTKAKSLL